MRIAKPDRAVRLLDDYTPKIRAKVPKFPIEQVRQNLLWMTAHLAYGDGFIAVLRQDGEILIVDLVIGDTPGIIARNVYRITGLAKHIGCTRVSCETSKPGMARIASRYGIEVEHG